MLKFVNMLVRRASTAKTGRYNDRCVPPLLVHSWSQTSIWVAVSDSRIVYLPIGLTRKVATECTRDGSGNKRHEPSDSNGSEVELVNALITCPHCKSFTIVVTRSFWRCLGHLALSRSTLGRRQVGVVWAWYWHVAIEGRWFLGSKNCAAEIDA